MVHESLGPCALLPFYLADLVEVIGKAYGAEWVHTMLLAISLLDLEMGSRSARSAGYLSPRDRVGGSKSSLKGL